MGERRESEIFDNGRRGEPRLGCDCVQCFGYCIVDYDATRRELPNVDEVIVLVREKDNG